MKSLLIFFISFILFIFSAQVFAQQKCSLTGGACSISDLIDKSQSQSQSKKNNLEKKHQQNEEVNKSNIKKFVDNNSKKKLKFK